MDHYQPADGETIGQYLKRLRTEADRPLDSIAKMSAHLSGPQRFTAAWLSSAENDQYKQPGIDRLKTLAGIYSRLLGSPIEENWLLGLAGYEPLQSIGAGPEGQVQRYLRYPDIQAMVIAAGMLVEAGHPEDTRLLVANAYRFLSSRLPELAIDEIYQDPILSDHVQNFLKEMGL